ncbi:MAG TPA: PaaI family thioesterase [Candidatus Binatia bacterium]
MSRMTAEELDAFLHREFPQVDEHRFRIEVVEESGVRVRMPFHEKHLRPGGTVSGPSLMTLADTAMYVAVLAEIGPVPLAVTTSLTINFLRRPRPADVIAEARLLKLGKRLAVGEVEMYSDGDPDMVAHATMTYSLPNER